MQHPYRCRSYAGVALGPAGPPAAGGEPETNIEVLVTSANHVVVVRGGPNGRILHRIGIEPPAEAPEPVPRLITVDLLPATSADGANGYRMELRVPGGRQVCGEDGSSTGCMEEELWDSGDIVLYADENTLLNDERGQYLMVLGRGEDVQIEDSSDLAVQVRACANPAAWLPGDKLGVVGSSALCWATASLGSPSVARIGRDLFGMALHGSTRDQPEAGYGRTNFSLGFLESSDIDVGWLDPQPGYTYQRFPVDTPYDVNCMGEQEWDTACPSFQLEPPEAGCETAIGRRSPHLVPGSLGEHLLLYSEMLGADPDLRRSSKVVAARFTPGSWSFEPRNVGERAGQFELTPSDLSDALGETYVSVRDPVAICKDLTQPQGACPDGTYLVAAVAEPSAWAGDDLVYAEYRVATGFEDTVAVLIAGDLEGGPLAGQEIHEPWLIWDPDTERFFLWVTAGSSGYGTHVDLVLGACPGCGSSASPLADATWRLYPGSPVLASEDLQRILRLPLDDPWVDCFDGEGLGGCEIGGVSGLLVEDEAIDQTSCTCGWRSRKHRSTQTARGGASTTYGSLSGCRIRLRREPPQTRSEPEDLLCVVDPHDRPGEVEGGQDQARVAPSRSSGGAPVSLPRKDFREVPMRIGRPVSASRPSARRSPRFPETSLPNPIPGSRTIRCSGTPASRA